MKRFLLLNEKPYASLPGPQEGVLGIWRLECNCALIHRYFRKMLYIWMSYEGKAGKDVRECMSRHLQPTFITVLKYLKRLG